jgi:hypothetical protein
MQSALDRNQAQAMGMAVGNQNMSPALAMKQALNAQTQMGLQTQGQMGAMRAQEQAQGQNALASWMMNQQAHNDQMVQYFQSLGYTMDEARMKAGMALEQGKFQAYEGQQNRNVQAQMSNNDSNMQGNLALLNAGATGLGAAAAGGAFSSKPAATTTAPPAESFSV